jgi:hypothetical protein
MVIIYQNNAECNVYYVKNNGNDSNSGLSDDLAWKTIQKVNTFSFSDGDSICFKRGHIFSDSKLKSPGKNNITFMDYGEGNKPLIDGDIVQPVYIKPTNKIYGITIKNIDISGQDWDSGKDSNLYIENVEGVTIDGVIGDGHKGGNTYAKTAIQVNNCTGKIVITNCELKNWGPTNLLTMGIDYCAITLLNMINGSYEISKNVIHDITSDAITVCDDTVPGLIKQNVFYNCGENGVDVKGTSNCTILDNEFYRTSDFVGEGGSGSGGYAIHVVIHPGYANNTASNNIVQSNLFHDGDSAAICIDSAFNTKIIDNQFKNIMTSIYIGNHSNTTLVQNNTIINPMYRVGYNDMDSAGIFENNAGSGTRILNNSIYNVSGSALHLISLASCVGTAVSNNIMYQEKSDAGSLLLYRWPDGSAPVINNNCWYNKISSNRVKYSNVIYTALDEEKWNAAHSGDCFKDPLFTDPTNLKFQLNPATPCQSNGLMWGAASKTILPPAAISVKQN